MNTTHAGLYPADGPAAAPRRAAWKFTAEGRAANVSSCVVSPPALADDGSVVVVGTHDGALAALDARTGVARWRTSLDLPRHSATHPRVAGDVVYVTDGAGVRALDLATGAARWCANCGDNVTSDVALSDELVLASTASGTLLALARDDGRGVWRAALPGGAPSPIATDGRTVVVTVAPVSTSYPAPGLTCALDARDGALRWSFDSGMAQRAAAALGDGVVYRVGGERGILYALDLDTGVERWSYHARQPLFLTPALDAERVYLASFYGRDPAGVHALDRATGAARWTFRGEPYASGNEVVLARNAVYATLGSTVHALDIATGAAHWAFAARDRVEGRAAVADGALFVATRRALLALRAPAK